MSAYTRRDLRVQCKRPYAREMRRFVCAFRLRTYGVRSVNPALRLCIENSISFVNIVAPTILHIIYNYAQIHIIHIYIK